MRDFGYRSNNFMQNSKPDYIPKKLLFKPPVSYPVSKKVQVDQSITNVTQESPEKFHLQIGESLTTTVFRAGNTYDTLDFP